MMCHTLLIIEINYEVWQVEVWSNNDDNTNGYMFNPVTPKSHANKP